MIFAISDFRGGFDEIIGIAVFQPIMALIFSLITIFICGLIGLPIRFNKKINKWWRERFYLSIILTFIGLLICVISFLPNLVQKVEYEINGIIEMVSIPNLTLFVSAWFLIAFGILHLFPPYKLEKKLKEWLDAKSKNKKTIIKPDQTRN